MAGREVDVDVEVVGRAAPSLADTLDLLHVERGLASVCVEAGPSSTRALYQEPLEVDELLLSTCLAEDVAPELQGETFASPELLAQRFRTAATVILEEESGRWSFARLVALPHAGSRVRTGRG